MTLACIALAALATAVLLSCTTKMNVGLLAIALAGLLGTCVAPRYGLPLSPRDIVAGFPADLFLTLTGVTLLFTLAQVNGTLGQVSKAAVRVCRGNAAVMPAMFFALTAAISSIGAGNISAAALIAPMALGAASRAGIPAALMVVMVGHGAIAGGLSPFTPMGVIAFNIMEQHGLAGLERETFAWNLGMNAAVAALGYAVFGGWRLLGDNGPPAPPADEPSDAPALSWRHGATLLVIAALIAGVIFFRAHLGLGSYVAVVLLVGFRLADERQALRTMPWGVIVMVCGMSLLVALVERAGGVKLCTSLLAGVSSRESITGMIAGMTGLLSVFSSTSGVVLPTFLPMVPDLVSELGGGDPQAIAMSINIGSSIVDVSPVSTIGALCVAAVGPDEDRNRVFNAILLWGLSMSALGALLCWLLL